jgi:hypothetical protein
MATPTTVTGAAQAPRSCSFPRASVDGGADVQEGRRYDVAPDGRFLINTELDSAAAPTHAADELVPAGPGVAARGGAVTSGLVGANRTV